MPSKTISIRVPKAVPSKRVPGLRKRVQEYVNAVLWDDNEGDFTWLISLMRYKIGRMRKCMATSPSNDREEITRQMKVVEDALWRIEDEEYFQKKCRGLPKAYNMRLATVDKDGRVTLDYVPLNPKKKMRKEEYHKKFKAAKKEAEDEYKADLVLAFETLRDYVRNWWD